MVRVPSPLVVLVSAALAAGCGSAKGASSSAAKPVNPAAIPVSVTAVAEQPITRFIRVSRSSLFFSLSALPQSVAA